MRPATILGVDLCLYLERVVCRLQACRAVHPNRVLVLELYTTFLLGPPPSCQLRTPAFLASLLLM